MRLAPRISTEKVVAIAGGAILLLIVVSSWVPQSCPLLRRALIGCPASVHPYTPTPTELELNRIPHQEVPTSFATIAAKPDQDRSDTLVTFDYRQKDLTHDPITVLQVLEGGSYVPLALISHPLLTNLDWTAVADSHYRLYQRSETYDTLSGFSAASAASQRLAADDAAARHFNLKQGSYQRLEDLTQLDSTDYILTTYAPPISNGKTWKSFRQQFDLSAASVDKDGKISLGIQAPHHAEGDNLLLGTVHLDFFYADRPL